MSRKQRRQSSRPRPNSGNHQTRRLLIALVGPTASGKSTLALRAAERLSGEIVNCDSMQMYRALNVGTAKPSREERDQVPHHLYDIIDPDEHFSAGQYMKEARRICREIAEREKIPLVVGGTGLYLRALLEGVFEGPGRSPAIRGRLRRIALRRGDEYLHRLLSRKDPGTAARIQPRDRLRVVRALEIYFLTGQSISDLQPHRESFKKFHILKIGLNLRRPLLYDRINRRVDEMFCSGLIEEVQELLEQGYSRDCKGFQAIGYRHVLALLDQGLSREQAVELTKRDTRRYAKRQLTWFRREENVHWMDSPGEDQAALEQLLRAVREHQPSQ